MKSRLSAAIFVAIVSALGAGCDLFSPEANSCVGDNSCNVGGIPTGPGSPTPEDKVTKVEILGPQTITLKRKMIRGLCMAQHQFEVRVSGNGTFSRNVTWETNNGATAIDGLFESCNKGTFRLRARSNQDGVVSDWITIRVEGDCGPCSGSNCDDGEEPEDPEDPENPNPQPGPAPTASLTAMPDSIQQGGSSDLVWACGNSQSAEWIRGKDGAAATTGVSRVVLNVTTTFTIRCWSDDGRHADASDTVEVTGPACPTSISYGPKLGIVSSNGHVELEVNNWPNVSCKPYWYLSRGAYAKVTAKETTVVDGTTYYAGPEAILTGIYPSGSTTYEVCVQLNIPSVQPKDCATWRTGPPTLAEVLGIDQDRLRRLVDQWTRPGVSQVK